MKIFNSLTRQIEEFVPIDPKHVGLYTCGPTVYDYATIGNLRTYTTSDLVNRVLRFAGYSVDFIMNITDVGHLSGDNLGDADTGEDRMLKAAARENRSAWDIAKFYTDAFLVDFEKLNFLRPITFTKATEYIQEQIDLVLKLEELGFAYKIDDGIYFDVAKFESSTHKKYGELSDLDKIKEGARVEPNPQKRGPRDFALWKFSEKPGVRHMEWNSPWGIGFPGWHIECSAMSMKHLGETFDVHVGGEDLKQTHHVNEIAQSEAVTGKKFVNYWVHSSFLKVDGGRMGKSLGNAYTASDVEKRGFSTMALRYLYLGAHYRDTLNFTWESLTASQNAWEKLNSHFINYKNAHDRTELSDEKLEKITKFREEFEEAVFNDLNTAKALSVAWSVVKSNIPDYDKYELLKSFDEVFGLRLGENETSGEPVSDEVKKLLLQRDEYRAKGEYGQADEIRKEIENMGYSVLDSVDGAKAFKK